MTDNLVGVVDLVPALLEILLPRRMAGVWAQSRKGWLAAARKPSARYSAISMAVMVGPRTGERTSERESGRYLISYS